MPSTVGDISLEEISISVCMATYNGAAFLHEQLTSILEQLKPQDELIIVDDNSKDATLDILNEYVDPRIRIYVNERNLGPNSTFERSIKLAKHDILLLADQDDRWLTGRRQCLLEALLRSGKRVVSSNSLFMNTKGEPIHFPATRLVSTDSGRHIHNIVNIFSGATGYFGCAMAFHRSILPLILPIPNFVESHDLWIALASNLTGTNLHVDQDTLARRIHGNNASVLQRSFHLKLWSRVVHARSIVVLLFRHLKAGS